MRTLIASLIFSAIGVCVASDVRRLQERERHPCCTDCSCGCNEGLPCCCCASPGRANPEPRKKLPAALQIAGPSNWGLITQDGNKITINGNDTWIADEGEIDKNQLSVSWIRLPEGRQAIGLYTVNDDGSIRGFWGYVEDFDGSKESLTNPETLRSTPPPVE